MPPTAGTHRSRRFATRREPLFDEWRKIEPDSSHTHGVHITARTARDERRNFSSPAAVMPGGGCRNSASRATESRLEEVPPAFAAALAAHTFAVSGSFKGASA